MTVSLPKTLRRFVAERVEQGGFGSVSDYVRELIRRDQRDQERGAYERTVVAATDRLDQLSLVSPELWRELSASLVRGEGHRLQARLEEAGDLFKTALMLMRERLRKEHPKAAAAEIERRLAQWLHDRGTDPVDEGPFRAVSAARLKRIHGE